MINGNIDGIKNLFLEELEQIYKIKVIKDEVVNENIVDIMTRISTLVDREISVAIDRKGKIHSVAVGDSASVELPLLDITEGRLSGVRVIHTHPNGYCNLSALDLSALSKLKLDAIVAIGIHQGKVVDFSIGMLNVYNDTLICEEKSNLSIEELLATNILDRARHIDSLIKENDVTEDNEEKAILVGSDTKESLAELVELAGACDIPVLDTVYQSRSRIDPAFFIGKGKVSEIASLRQTKRANLIIFDDELSGSQVRNLENATGAKVIDRTTLILEIFARRAKSKESKIQVELAQLKYRKSRLQGLGTVLSRTGGGIGTRGPGEKKLETDRRHINESIYDLNDELKKIKKNRDVQREKRSKESIPNISLVGYTNAGKSTLRNALCEMAAVKENKGKEKVFEADMLFATLDITTRAIVLKNKGLVTLTDTVGFVRKLPHDLVEAFKSTLEEVLYADLLCHIVDASSDVALEQMKAVEEVLGQLGAGDKETILVLNKIDRVEKEALISLRENLNYDEIIEVSAKEGNNLEELLQLIERKLPYNLIRAEYIIPYDKGDMVSFLHRNGRIFQEDYRDEGTFMEVEVDEEVYNKSIEYIIKVIK
ncbi:MAG TPA: GTPase HflX [Clostridium sp.]